MLLLIALGSAWQVVGSIRVQKHSTYVLPVARATFSSQRIALPGSLEERHAPIQNVWIKVGMTLRRRHELDRAVTMFVDVLAHQCAHQLRAANGYRTPCG
ncbi:hypothetical protein [Paraburkholderia rhynchosiae]|uniref:hypothetical protein n=1 Tax=Paraburkholderia rhynchosiae TaxID=487049 RepID=UPI0011AF8FFE|nr:hypothetical protein [Paraburkholderia rhynchosiae]